VASVVQPNEILRIEAEGPLVWLAEAQRRRDSQKLVINSSNGRSRGSCPKPAIYKHWLLREVDTADCRVTGDAAPSPGGAAQEKKPVPAWEREFAASGHLMNQSDRL
jgi:hypothetical protein